MRHFVPSEFELCGQGKRKSEIAIEIGRTNPITALVPMACAFFSVVFSLFGYFQICHILIAINLTHRMTGMAFVNVAPCFEFNFLFRFGL